MAEIKIECKFTNHTESKLTRNICRNINKLQIKGFSKNFYAILIDCRNEEIVFLPRIPLIATSLPLQFEKL